MKLLRFSIDGTAPRLGLYEGDAITDLSSRIAGLDDRMEQLIERWDEYRVACDPLRGVADYHLSDVRLTAPIARPGKIFGIGLNYADHIAEAGMELPTHQTWFSKASTAVNGPFDDVELPKVSSALDYEAELVFVIGRRCRHVSQEQAATVIFGYAVGNDVSVRDWQLRTSQFILGKSFDTHAPFGPWIVTADEVDPANLGIRSFVNGELRQNSNTKHLIFDCAAQVAELSQVMTLEPGDIIYTGTPGGVGGAMTPPCFLKAGDRVRVEIDHLGHIENSIQPEV
ncbi:MULTISPECIES: fumarylacetoacetate hydrolase family protein [Sphingobium]|uniref:fumarylacetoacetate hydrolase family protein n=1 Tax=Sphingobium sp. MI1205 TaxID=407020 RepID=UPI0007702BD0|nr:fumarylacetoacetate hydrolase family protein [Sphingobium sp. MI1205]AMK19583.1 ureidoglycolate lyase [Sphingobium sp. MI1205]